MYKLFCRAFQKSFWVGSRALPWRYPERLKGYAGLTKMLADKECTSVLIVTDSGIVGLGLHNKLIAALDKAGINYFVYDSTVQNPTIDNIEEALHLYKIMQCSAIIAIGGGSCIDCAKGVGARVARPKTSISKLRGLLKVILPMPTLVAIPTTAGSGS